MFKLIEKENCFSVSNKKTSGDIKLKLYIELNSSASAWRCQGGKLNDESFLFNFTELHFIWVKEKK